MRPICKTCKTKRELIWCTAYLGRRLVWKCKCGNRMATHHDRYWMNQPGLSEDDYE